MSENRAAGRDDETSPVEKPTQFGYVTADRSPAGEVIIVGPFDTREEAEQSAGGLPIIEMAPEEAVPGVHLFGCPNFDGPCCPWMGECDCQCMCDFIAQIVEWVRAEYDPSESDADEGYRRGYTAAVEEFMSNHGDDATFKLGYKKALLDITEKARNEQGATFATVKDLMKDLNEEPA